MTTSISHGVVIPGLGQALLIVPSDSCFSLLFSPFLSLYFFVIIFADLCVFFSLFVSVQVLQRNKTNRRSVCLNIKRFILRNWLYLIVGD